MEEFITPERIANAIMQDNRFEGYYLIVEGNKDVKLYSKFIKKDNIRIRPALGNMKVKETLSILEERDFKKKFGIIDSDFNKIILDKIDMDCLFETDDHDIEVMMINSRALENVVSLFCTPEKIIKFEKINKTNILDSLFNVAIEVGYLKLANKINDLGLSFKPKTADGNLIRYSNFTCIKSLKYLGDEKLIDSVISYSRVKNSKMKKKPEIERSLIKSKKTKYDRNQLVNGHDLCNVLFILMKKVLGSSNKMLVNNNSVEDSLILSYEYVQFQETTLYNNIKEWSDSKKIQVFN